MVQDKDLIPLWEWLMPGPQSPEGIGGFSLFVVVVFLLTLIGVLASFLSAAIGRGPIEAFYAIAKGTFDGVADLLRMSPRRVLAMARLAFAESIRRWVLVVFAVFVLLLLFAGWFLDVESDHPARLYMSFVLTTPTFLVLFLALFLSTFSLPSDVKNRTIYTVVTKPVRAGEIVLGRILGFCAIGTLLLALMCAVSYFFVIRGVAHGHTINAEDVIEVPSTQPGEPPIGFEAMTSLDARHRHHVILNADGEGFTDTRRGHRHPVKMVVEGDKRRYVVGPPQDVLEARVPVYGKLSFLDRQGKPSPKGINVGNEWTYRSYFEGRTPSAAIWTFEGITPERFPDDQFARGLPLELNIRVFRTHKGNIEEGILGSIVLINPEAAAKGMPVETAPIFFVAQEFVADRRFIPRELNSNQSGPDGKPVKLDLFRDLAPKGRLQVRIQCLRAAQYFGVAQADVYFRAADGSFAWNFAKGYLGIWMQMVLVTTFGVMFSTFLSGPVAMMATLASIVMGYFAQFISDVGTGEIVGGGPLEALIRLAQQKNVMTELDQNLGTSIAVRLDEVAMTLMRGVSYILPDYGSLSTANYVAFGFNIPINEVMAIQLTTTAAYVLVVSIIAFFILKSRELAA